jgi:membrane protease YdiL (CAAX protease family)
MDNTRGQLAVLVVLVIVYGALAFLFLALGLQEQMLESQSMSTAPLPDVPAWVLGLVNAGIVIVVYGLAGVAGLWFARRLGLPGSYRERAGWRRWFVIPAVLGLAVGLVMTLLDRIAASSDHWRGLSHPPFPFSLIASATAGIGEEIMFRMFLMGLWAFLLNLLLRRWKKTPLALWIGNVVAALAFGAGHLPAAMMLLGVASPAQIPPLALAEIFVLNGLVGLVAGDLYMRDGLVAAAGVHFWADIVWHVIWPLLPPIP